MGQGNLLYMAGRYQEALPTLEKAAALATRLDNRTLLGECASQLALVQGRLGNATLQIHWAKRALQLFPQAERGSWVVGAIYELGLGLVAEGRYAEAQSSVAALSQRREHDVPPWITQASLLFAADVLALSGNARGAYRLAKRATTGHLAILLQVPTPANLRDGWRC